MPLVFKIPCGLCGAGPFAPKAMQAHFVTCPKKPKPVVRDYRKSKRYFHWCRRCNKDWEGYVRRRPKRCRWCRSPQWDKPIKDVGKSERAKLLANYKLSKDWQAKGKPGQGQPKKGARLAQLRLIKRAEQKKNLYLKSKLESQEGS